MVATCTAFPIGRSLGAVSVTSISTAGRVGTDQDTGRGHLEANPMRADFEASSTGITWTRAFHPAEGLNADQFVVATLKPN